MLKSGHFRFFTCSAQTRRFNYFAERAQYIDYGSLMTHEVMATFSYAARSGETWFAVNELVRIGWKPTREFVEAVGARNIAKVVCKNPFFIFRSVPNKELQNVLKNIVPEAAAAIKAGLPPDVPDLQDW